MKADPYKHRAMRICGEPERLITGDAPEAEKWAAWMRTLPKLVGNPLFAWARPELEFLGLDPEPYLHGRGEDVPLAGWTPQRILRAFNVEWMSPCVGASQLKGNGQDARSRGWASRLPAGVCPSLRTAAGSTGARMPAKPPAGPAAARRRVLVSRRAPRCRSIVQPREDANDATA